MVSFAVSADEEKLVDDIARGLLVQIIQDAIEALPLGQVGCALAVLLVSLVDESKVDSSLVDRPSVITFLVHW